MEGSEHQAGSLGFTGWAVFLVFWLCLGIEATLVESLGSGIRLLEFKYCPTIVFAAWTWGSPSASLGLGFNILKIFCLLILERQERKGGRGERRWFIVPLIYAFIGWFLYVPWLGLEPATSAHRDDTLTNWATWPGPGFNILKWVWQ